MQYRCPVDVGPSLKTCPRCPPHVAHTTSVRFIPPVWSSLSSMFPFSKTSEKLGQPEPESNFVSEAKSGVPQAAQVYMPLSLLRKRDPVNGISVPFSRSVLYCFGVSFSFP